MVMPANSRKLEKNPFDSTTTEEEEEDRNPFDHSTT